MTTTKQNVPKVLAAASLVATLAASGTEPFGLFERNEESVRECHFQISKQTPA